MPPRWVEASAVRPMDVTVQHPDGRVDLLFRPHVGRQLEALTAMEPNVWLWGPRGTSKSTVGRWLMHTLALRTSGFRYCVVRRHHSELERSFLQWLPDELERLGGERQGFWYQGAGMHGKTAHYGNGSLGWFATCDNDEDLRKVVGLEYHALLIDESPEMPWQWILSMAASLRATVESGIQPLLRLLGNPRGVSVDEHVQFFRTEPDVELVSDPDYDPAEWRAIRLELSDNPSIDASAYRRRFVGLDAATRAAWVDGERVVAGAIFRLRPEHRRTEGLADLVTVDARVYRSITWGLVETDPAVCLWVLQVGRRLLVVREEIWVGLAVPTMAASLHATEAAWRRLGFPAVRATYAPKPLEVADDAVYSLKDDFEAHRVPMETIPVLRLQTTAAIHRVLSERLPGGVPLLQILPKTEGVIGGCPTLLRTLPRQRSDPHAPSQMAEQADSGPAKALGQFLLSEASVLAPRSVATGVARPAWHAFRPVSRRRRA